MISFQTCIDYKLLYVECILLDLVGAETHTHTHTHTHLLFRGHSVIIKVKLIHELLSSPA